MSPPPIPYSHIDNVDDEYYDDDDANIHINADIMQNGEEEEEEEGEGENLLGDGFEDDYRHIPELDRYDPDMLDDAEVEGGGMSADIFPPFPPISPLLPYHYCQANHYHRCQSSPPHKPLRTTFLSLSHSSVECDSPAFVYFYSIQESKFAY